MKVKIIKRSEDMIERYDYRDSYAIELNTNHNTIKMSFWDGEPEDANLSRDFNDVFSIKEAIIEAYEAGMRGETLELEEVVEEE